MTAFEQMEAKRNQSAGRRPCDRCGMEAEFKGAYFGGIAEMHNAPCGLWCLSGLPAYTGNTEGFHIPGRCPRCDKGDAP
jgi:hypothetical protein